MRPPFAASFIWKVAIIERLKILVVDDARSNLLMLRALLSDHGHAVVTASDGLEAIQAFHQEDPDVILMDVMMPNMDGIEASRRIRDVSKVVPIIFLSAATDAAIMEQALQLGSDYIAKPIQIPQLLDKLNAHFRTVLAYRELLGQKKELQQLHQKLIEENTVAAHVVARMLSKFLPPGGNLQYTVIPSGIFSGDIVLAGTTPSGRLNVMLADAIGHGLSAAFSLMPIVPAFDAMTRKGFPLRDILFEINNTLRNLMPVGNFTAATAVSMDFVTGIADVWVGGNPGLMIVSNRALRQIASKHLALGLIEHDDKAEFVCESVQLNQGDRLVFSSDGLIETWQKFIQESEGDLGQFILACQPSAIFDRLKEVTRRYNPDDDTSFAVLHMAPEVKLVPQQTGHAAKEKNARLALDLNPAQLARPDITRQIVDVAQKMGIVASGDGLFGMVFTELFANALDHGVLRISSEIKYAGLDGFDEYMRQREAALACLAQGRISVQIELSEFSGKPATLLRIVDSGPGFDQALLAADPELGGKSTAGRGFQLVVNTCYKVSYAGAGNDVTAYVPRP